MISKSSQYALRAVIYLAARNGKDEKIGMADIAKAIETPAAFTAKIMQVLTRENIVSSIRGPKGGFYLDGFQLKQPILNIIQAIDGMEIYKGCGLGLKLCSNKSPCPIHDVYQDVRNRMVKLFKNTTVSMLADRHSKGMKLANTILM